MPPIAESACRSGGISSLIRNKSSGALGKKSMPTRIDPFKDDLQSLIEQHLQHLPEDIHSIYQLSQPPSHAIA